MADFLIRLDTYAFEVIVFLMRYITFLFIAFSLMKYPAAAGEKATEYNIALIAKNEKRLQIIMNKVRDNRGENISHGNSSFKVLQHINDNNYIIKRGEMPVAAAIIKIQSGLIPDDTIISGFLFPTDKTITYTSVTCAKKTVSVFDYQSGEYAFQNTVHFIKCVKHAPTIFYCYGDDVKCDNCDGWGKFQARTQTGHKPCAKCAGSGKLNHRLNIVWKDFEEKD